ncbi:unnamed protein product [Linum trigynum]|uniref:Uncharacterized protein n=1 Tax=Linum trigynum TaxID=586398 RepID=A0AAV2E8Q1_9ROSI
MDRAAAELEWGLRLEEGGDHRRQAEELETNLTLGPSQHEEPGYLLREVGHATQAQYHHMNEALEEF